MAGIGPPPNPTPDLRAVDCMESAGVQVLWLCASQLERRGGRLSLRGAGSGVLGAIEGAGLAPLVAPDQGGPGAASDPAGSTEFRLPARRRPDAHPAGRGRQAARRGGRR